MKPKKPMTPYQVYRAAKMLAKKAGVSLRAYCIERDVNHSTVCKWKEKKTGSVYSDIKEKLLNEQG